MLVHRKKTAGAVLAAVLLVGGATACEDGKKDGAAKPAASTAAAPSKAAVEVKPAAYLEKVKKKSEEITSLRYTMSGTAMGEKVSGEASMRMKPTVAMAMKMATPGATGGAESVEIRMLDGAMYMGTEGKWMKFDIKAMDPETAKQMENLGQASQSGQNPSDQADALLKAQDLKSLGDETIDGVKTRHFVGTVPLEKMRASLATATPEEKERQEKSLKALEGEGIKSLTLDMWIDEQDHTKQVRTRGTATKGPMDMTIKFLDYNKPVEITAPPADQVMDLGQMMKDSGGQG
ncbi:LppX_LprAFG lipoprotein [Streptomyces sp. NPDC048272]|uniref:LppX_LprAFG lipoprotein n=1 Tax=Streptomyces sp. NPDC048272 TaxID=3154616 RepID=UPI0034324DC7